METLFIIACTIMSALLIWELGWLCLLAPCIGTLLMLALFHAAGPGN